MCIICFCRWHRVPVCIFLLPTTWLSERLWVGHAWHKNRVSAYGGPKWTMASFQYQHRVRGLYNEPFHEKTCLRGVWPGETQTSLLSFRSQLEAWKFGYSNCRYYTTYAVKNKDADKTVQMDRLICVFVVHTWHQQAFSLRGSIIVLACFGVRIYLF